MNPIDYRLYAVTSGTTSATITAAVAAAGAGAGVIQVRAKQLQTRELLAWTTAVARAVAATSPSARLVVDDRADVAFALMRAGEHVHGVHLGQDDLPVRDARAMLGPDAIIGMTTGTLALVEAANAVADVVDYLGAGPFRPTPTKDSGRPPLGVAGYPPLVAATSLPLIAIGDITGADVPALRRTGVAGVAVVRAIFDAEDPAKASRGILDAWSSNRS